ncbi:MAG TPA: trypsin-like peptidase domain-containing protein, partial [Chloroflexia bacterium]|nr:trypsin-like peptidase domain-containing protein [Chloroflexia bacterium]
MSAATLIAPTPLAVLPGAISDEIIAMIDRVRPSVVQVRRGRHGSGAGVIWQTDGGIITNNHVVAGHGGTIEVLLTDGRTLEAQVTARNRTLDLAMLKVAADDLPAAPVADSTRLRVGDLVFAVGHPWGQRGVVTAGIVSGLGHVRAPGSRETAPYIRSDVLLAPGNSGGPLLDATGAVAGINAMIFGGDLGVAIPSHVTTAWVAELPGRPMYLGVELRPVQLQTSPRRGPWPGRAHGSQVVAITPGSPAATA